MLGAVVVIFFICVLPFQMFTLWIILVPRATFLKLDSQVKNIKKHKEIYFPHIKLINKISKIELKNL